MSTTEADLHASITREAGDVIVAVGGDLDLMTTPRLRHLLLDLVRAQGNLSVVLNMAQVTFIDSSALGLIVTLHRELRDRAGTFIVRNPSRAVQRVFEITGLDRSLNLDI
jgi:anti-anti-sigma factor